MHAYRHNCGELRAANARSGRLSGWIHRKRDHGNLLFVDLRDHFGLTQCVIEVDSGHLSKIEALRLETVICVTGRIEERGGDTKNLTFPRTSRIADRYLRSTRNHRAVPLEVNTIGITARKYVCVTGSSICAATRCIGTSCCAAR